jgi:hypothetical protein
MKWGRDFARAVDIHSRLNWKGDLFDPIRSKPKGMHWTTYFDWCGEFDESLHRGLRGAVGRN